jgi:hypothetical protein
MTVVVMAVEIIREIIQLAEIVVEMLEDDLLTQTQAENMIIEMRLL